MKTSNKIALFVVIAFVIIVIVTFATRSTAVAPVTTITPTSTSTPSMSPSVSPAAATYTLAQVAMHKTATDCWTSVSGGVYNLTPFVNQHPGGVANIIKLCGIEGTSLFMAQHGGQGRPEAELASLKIGTLAK